MGRSELKTCLAAGAIALFAAGPALADGLGPVLDAMPQVFAAVSTTAMAITGDIEMSRFGIVFANGAAVGLSPVATRSAADWQSGFGAGAGPVQLFRLAGDPGTLLNGNTLCGPGTATHLAVQWITSGGLKDLVLAVYEGPVPPDTAAGPGMCGTFTYGPPAE
jgi:hypothetical protein